MSEKECLEIITFILILLEETYHKGTIIIHLPHNPINNGPESSPGWIKRQEM